MNRGGLVCLVGFGVRAFLCGEAPTEDGDLRFEMVVTDDFAAWQRGAKGGPPKKRG